MSQPLHIVILAAGDGKRMKSGRPKVLQPVGGRSMLAHVHATATRLGADRVHIVYNPQAGSVRQALGDAGVDWVEQSERLGTGHAVQQAMPRIPDDARVLVLYGDLPLLQSSTVAPICASGGDGFQLLTMVLDDPTGYGRILRDDHGRVTGIVEEKDASDAQRRIREVNSGIICAPARLLRGWLVRLGSDNSQGEYYLTDAVSMAHADGIAIEAIEADAAELAGANDPLQLAELENALRRRRARELMEAGVRIVDPARIDIRGPVETGRDVSLDVNVILEGEVSLGDGVEVGAGSVIRNSRLAAGTRVHPYSIVDGAVTHGACDIGPFARVRPGTVLNEASRIGNFVEVKNTVVGERSKANHLSYLGDSSIGRDVNIGAGTITCNYDGVHKHRTVIGDGVFVGSDTQLVAPVSIGDHATIGAGSTITKDAPDGKLTLSRAKQVTVDSWKRPKKEKAEQ